MRLIATPILPASLAEIEGRMLAGHHETSAR